MSGSGKRWEWCHEETTESYARSYRSNGRRRCRPAGSRIARGPGRAVSQKRDCCKKEAEPVRILIAEDDLSSRALLEAVLKRDGHDVLATVSGAQAWEILQQADSPRLAILDWIMPELDGLEVVRRVRSRQSDSPPYLIMLTTQSGKGDIVAGLDAGADDYLTKPFDARELRARVEVGRRMLATQAALASKVRELGEALEQVRTLRGILPICASCKMVRNDAGYWQQVEVYVSDHTEAEFSHGICPDCMRRLYPEFHTPDDGDAGEER